MRRARISLTAAAVVALVCGVAAPELWAIKLDETAIFFEINDTDGDAGIQIFLDGEGFRRMRVFDPDGNKIIDFRTGGSVSIQGIAELFFESSEPSFKVQPLEDLLALFPEGKYRFEGTTTDGLPLMGKARLTHDLPGAPMQVFPNDEELDPDDAEFVWAMVADPLGSKIVGYHVVVECEEPELQVFTADVGPTVTSITVSPEVLDQGGGMQMGCAGDRGHRLFKPASGRRLASPRRPDGSRGCREYGSGRHWWSRRYGDLRRQFRARRRR